jgi:hypothetical protein
MAFTSILTRLLLLIAPAEAVNQVVRRVGVEANGRVRSNRVSSEELEAKRADLLSSGESSTAARRDLLWQAVREVDDESRQKPNCKLEVGTTYAKEVMLLAEQTSYSKTNTTSARECALMCAADSLEDSNHKNLACKSFTFNKTAHECKFFNFAPQAARGTWNKDACCTSGLPCNLDNMREEIQSHFHAELDRIMLSHKHLANQPKIARRVEKPTVPKIEQKVATQSNVAAPKSSEPKIEQKLAPRPEHSKLEQKVVTQTEHNFATQPERVAPKVEQKVSTQAVHATPKHTVPKVEQKVAVQPERPVPKIEQKVATQTEHVVPKFEQKGAGSVPKHTVPNVEKKVSTQAEHLAQKVAGPVPKHAVPKVEQKATTQAEHAVPKFERKVDGAVPKHTVPKVEQKVAPVPKRTVPKVEQKVSTQAEHVAQKVAGSVPKHTVPKVEQKVTTQTKHAVPKFEQKAVTQPERAVPKVEQKVVTHKFDQKAAGPVPKHTVPNVEQKVTTQAAHVVPKFEHKVAAHVAAAQTKQTPTLPAESMEKNASINQPRGAVRILTNLVWIHWRLLLVFFCVSILVVVFARWLQGGLVKRLDA